MFYQLIFMLRRYDSSSNECLYVVTGEMCWSVALSSIIILILSFIAYETFENTYIISCHLRGRHSAASIRSLSIKYPPFSSHQSSCQTILSLYFYIDQYIFSIWHQLLLSLLYSFLHNFSPLYFMASIRTQHTTYHPVILSGSFSMSVVCSSLRVNHQRCMV